MPEKAVSSRRSRWGARFFAVAAVGVSMFFAGECSADAEQYSFFVSGYPADNPRSIKESSAIGLVSGSLSKSTVGTSLEARFRTLGFSGGTSLRSDRFRFFGIVIR